VLVDEFQDTNRVQYLLARNLSLHGGNLFAVGDDDQSIYSWRGADVGNILDFESDHPNAKVVKLEQNYRSTGNILEAAFGVIRNNRNRKPKKLWTSSGEGELISYHVAVDERREAAYVAEVARRLHRKSMLGDLAVFYRTHAQSRALEEALRAASVPYRMVAATKFYDRAEIKDLISYLRVLFNPASDIDLQRIINAPKRGIGAATVKRCASIAGSKKVSLYEAVRLAARPQEGILGTGARKKVAAFVSVMEELCELASHSLPSTLAEAVLEKTGYTEALSTRADRESLGRIENLMELVGSIRAYEADADEPSLEEFLERVALTSDADGETGQGAAVTLMTVHAAKGLEFPEVIVTGLEEGVFPHARGLYEEHELEEERRLAYVAFTRAKRKLHLTRTVSRSLMGQVRRNAPARFLLEMGSHLLQHEHQQGAGGSGDLFGSRARSRGQRAPARESHPYLSDEWAAASRSKPSSGHVFGSGKPISGGAKSRRPSSPAKPIRRRRSKSKKKAGAGGWYAGMKVRHKKFGPGTVQAWYGNPPEQKISVYFFNHGVKTIMASYLQIAE
jgi:DNA helicase-2/ATP-dependent DNA helicase PcrA